MIETETFKQQLLTEKGKLEKELATLGKKNDGQWETVPENLNTDPAEDAEMAEAMEDFEENNAVEHDLANRLEDVNLALGKIDAGTYGTCEVCGGEIETARLEANPAARTCTTHM